MLTILLIIPVIVLLFGSLPTWGYSRRWGYYPSGACSFILVVLFVLLLFDVL